MTKQYTEIQLSSLAHDGRAVGRMEIDGQNQRVVFVQGALPGQKVLAHITKLKKNFAEGVCVDVLQQSADFVAPLCVHAEECGGCSLQSMPYEKQLFWKQNMLKEALQRIGKVQHIPLSKMYASPLLWGYRNKMEFAVGLDAISGKVYLGLRASASHNIIPTPHCLLMPQECEQVLQRLEKLINGTGFEPWNALQGQGASTQKTSNSVQTGLWRHVVIRMPHAEGKKSCHIQIITAPASAEQRLIIARLGQDLLTANLGVVGFVHEERDSSTLYAQGERCITQLGERHLCEKLAGVSYKIAHNSFFQVNTLAAEHLCVEAKAMADLKDDEIIWDIYCGVGAPGLGLAKHAKALYGVESSAQAIDMARHNAAQLGYEHCNYVVAKAERLMKSNHKSSKIKPVLPKPDVIVVDPPRAGMHADVVQTILAVNPKRIVYISCNPATLARDIALLGVKYELGSLSAVDLFPHTAHVESCALLIKKSA